MPAPPPLPQRHALRVSRERDGQAGKELTHRGGQRELTPGGDVDRADRAGDGVEGSGGADADPDQLPQVFTGGGGRDAADPPEAVSAVSAVSAAGAAVTDAGDIADVPDERDQRRLGVGADRQLRPACHGPVRPDQRRGELGAADVDREGGHRADFPAYRNPEGRQAATGATTRLCKGILR
ncbi:hypothetical protein GCM10018952_60580 [Streptosporangium vulgare]